MLKKSLFFFFFAALLSPVSLWAQREIVRLTRYEGERITGLSVDSFFDVDLVYTPDRAQNRAVVEISPEFEEHLRLTLSPDGVLHVSLNQRHQEQNYRNFGEWLSQLKSKKKFDNKKFTAKLTVTLSELTRLKVSGSVDVHGSGPRAFPGERLEVNCSGAGSIKLTVQSKNLSLGVSGSGRTDLMIGNLTSAKVAVSGAGKAILRGSAEQADFTVSGSGDIQAKGFRLLKAKVKVSGAGDIDCFATESLSGSVSGAGRIRYAGGPKKVDIGTSGSGSVGKL